MHIETRFRVTYLPPTSKLLPSRNTNLKWSIVDSFPWNFATMSDPAKGKEKKERDKVLFLANCWYDMKKIG